MKHGCSLHPISRYIGLRVGCDGDGYFLGFYLIFISVMEHISYLVMSSSDVSNMADVISSFGDSVENCCTESSVAVNCLISLMIFPHIHLPPCPFWSMFPRTLVGKIQVVIMCDRCCMLGSIIGDIVDS